MEKSIFLGLKTTSTESKPTFPNLSLHKKFLLIPFQPFLAIDAFFIFLLILEALTSLRLVFFIITAVEMYLWICMYSLYEEFKINDRIRIAQYDAEIQKQ
jgi:hypothetical protein